jgi:hypothetical protein
MQSTTVNNKHTQNITIIVSSDKLTVEIIKVAAKKGTASMWNNGNTS